MATRDHIEIPLNRRKLFLMLLGAIVFIALGVWFISAPPQIGNSYWGGPAKLAFAGYASIFFFGLCAIILLRKLTDDNPGLIIDDTGLTDNSSGFSAGHILWTDIQNISIIEVQKQRLILLEVANPKDYIDRQNNLIKRKSLALNYKMYGSPICISASGLQIPFHELFALITQRYINSRTQEQYHFHMADFVLN